MSGGVFELMALGGLVVALAKLVGQLREVGRPSPVFSGSQPLVRAVIPPGLADAGWQPTGLDGWFPGGAGGSVGAGGVGGVGGLAGGSRGSPASPGRAAAIVSASAWLVASLVGAAVGIVVSSPLISALN